MKNSHAHVIALLAVLLATPDAARAANHGWYIGAAYSDVCPDYAPRPQLAFPAGDTPSRYARDGMDTIGSEGLKLVAGIRALDWLAFEADYLDLSGDSQRLGLVCVTQLCPDFMHTETANASLSALAPWPVGKFDIFARVGLSHWESSLEMPNDDGSQFWSQSLSGTDEKYGAGAQLHIHKVTARLEYEHLRFSGDAADKWSVSRTFFAS